MIKRIDDPGDKFLGTITFDLDDGRYLRVSVRDLKEYGLKEILKHYSGVEVPTKPVMVFQRNQLVGKVPALWQPEVLVSKSPLYSWRPGDFEFRNNAWYADPMLGAGDLAAIEGFTFL